MKRKNGFKRALACLLVVVMLLTTAPLAGFVGLELPEWSQLFDTKASAASSDYLTSGFCGEVTETTDGTQLSWVLDDAGTLTVTGMGRMAKEAFKYDLRIKNVIIGEGVENIASSAFSECSNLVSVEVPNGAETIDTYAFYQCDKLTDITLPDSLTSIGSHAFAYCDALTNITFPDSLTSIGSTAFYGCNALAIVSIGSGLTSIGSFAFYGCDALATVSISSGLTSIGSHAFSFCDALTNITLPDSLTSIGSSAFWLCRSLTNIVLPDSVTSVGNGAFDKCTSLTTVSIGAGLRSLDVNAFDSCSKLSAISVSEDNTTYSSVDGIVYNKEKTKLLIVPEAVSGEITIPKTVKEFTYQAVDSCKNLTAINVEAGNLNYKSVDGIVYSADGKTVLCCPRGKAGAVAVQNGAKSIDERVFYQCDKLTDVTLPDSLTSIGYSAFEDCSALTNITLPDSLISIGYHAFDDCDALTNITLPDTLTSIGSEAFFSCDVLTDITLPDSLTSIGSWAFGYCDALTDIVLPDSVTSVGSYAFGGCESLITVSIGSGLKSLSVNAFEYCYKLSFISVSEDNTAYASVDGIVYNKEKTQLLIVPEAVSGEITIPKAVEEFTYKAVERCKNLIAINVEAGHPNYKSVDGIVYTADGKTVFCCPRGKVGSANVQNGAESIDEYAFYKCSKLTDITLPDTLTSIGYSAFQDCETLANITFPDSLISIGSGAFCDCDALTNITLPDSLTSIGSYAFAYCYALTNITLPDSLTSIGDCAFEGCSALTDITLPESLTSIGSYAFADCIVLKSINIPPAITKITNNIFEYCGFTELTLPETVQSFDYASWSKLKTLTIENKYCKYTSTAAPSFPADCTVRAYCGSPGHELAVKRLLNFESLGHTYLGWYTVTPATYEADGIERRDCAYCGGYEERVIPKLQQDVFTATFVADGETIATVDFPKGAAEIEEPAVPAKDRYIGEWEDYTLSDSDLTINAVYTLIKSENASDIHTDSNVVHYTDTDDVLFKLRAWSDAKVIKSTVSKAVPLDIVLVVDQSGSMDETLGSSTKKIDALKNTAKEFINTVFENAKMTRADHRISLVGFGLSGNYKGFEKNENTELLTSERGIVKFENIKSSDYASSLLSVSAAGAVNEALLNAVDSIEARGATAADLGFEMAKGVFANTDSTDRQRVVVFMTDGEPTYLSGFQTSVANSAIANAATLKKAYDASIYSVGVFSKRESEDANINRFMNAVSSGYPDAQSMRYPGDGTDGLFYTTVNNTDTLSSVFKSISTEALSHTAPFDNLTVIKTLSPYVTMTSQQEEKLRVDLIREYGITNDDIIITRNADGTTTVQVNNLTPKETTDENGNIIYEVKFEFFASLNEKAAQIGEYPVDTEDSGVMLGADAMGYEATFDMSSIELTAGKTRVIFTINGKVYEISENISNGYAVAPEFKVGEGWSFVRWDTSSKKATNGMVLDATLTKADRTITWHTADGDIVQTYVEGDFIAAPTVGDNQSGEKFLSWDRSVPTTMPDESLEFTAVYGEHIHNYTSEVTKKVTCVSDGERTYTCSCGDSYTEVIPAIGHNYRAITPSIEKDDAKCTFVCENCGDKYDYALDYAVVKASQKHFRVLYEFQLTDDDLNCGFQPDGAIEIKIPLSELHDSAEKATVIRTNPDGSKTVVPSRHEKGFLIITCDHFTPYEVIFDINCEEHEQGEWIVVTEPTCTEDGERYAECVNCEKEIAREVIPALGHSFTNYVSNGDATCTVDGTKTAKCDRCDVTDTVTDENTKLGHSFTNYVSNNDATCTADGTKTAKCDRCDVTDTVTDENTKLGHSFTNYVSNNDAACTVDGTKTAKCDRCDVTDTVTDEGSAKGHTIVIDKAVAPTCTETGLTEGQHCSVCGEVLVKQEVIQTADHTDSDHDGKCDTCGKDMTENCTCICHKGGFMGFIYKIIRIFWKLFGTNKTCACGQAHY